AKWNPGGIASAYGTAGTRQSADINAWLGDIRTSFQLGPLLLSGMVMWTTGQDAKSNPYKSIKYYQPLDTDTSYLADWGTQIMSLGIDYFHILYNNATGLNPGVAIGYDKYGRIQVGGKVAYAVTPTFTVGAGVTTDWTDKKVDTDSTLGAGGLAPLAITTSTGRPQGDSRYLGTEVNLSTTYRF